jgi:hypothetical protein
LVFVTETGGLIQQLLDFGGVRPDTTKLALHIAPAIENSGGLGPVLHRQSLECIRRWTDWREVRARIAKDKCSTQAPLDDDARRARRVQYHGQVLVASAHRRRGLHGSDLMTVCNSAERNAGSAASLRAGQGGMVVVPEVASNI